MQARHKDTWLFVSLCILVFWAPIPLGSNRGWSLGLLQSAYAFIALALSLLLAKGSLSATAALRGSAVTITLFLAIPLWALLQLIPLPPHLKTISLDIGASIYSIQHAVWLAIVFIICVQLINSTERLKTLGLVIVASGLFEACYAVLTILGGADFDILGIKASHAGSATGTFMNRNHLAGHLQMCLAIGIGLLIANLGHGNQTMSWRERIRNLLHTLLGPKARQRLFLIVMVIALVMTHSRMGNTAFFASMGISAVIGYMIFKRRSRAVVILFGSMILIDALIISSWFGLERLANRIEQTVGSREGRLSVNAEAWLWFKEHWLAGSGAGSFTTVFPSYRSSDVIGFYDYAHNDYLQLLGEYGVLGASLFAAIALYTLWTSIKAQRTRHNPVLRGLAFGSMMGILSLLIHSSTDFNLHIPSNAALFTILCAIAFICLHMPSKTQRAKHRHESAVSHAPIKTTTIRP
jgi:putative inorganic carbon (hco3(-)) transporter